MNKRLMKSTTRNIKPLKDMLRDMFANDETLPKYLKDRVLKDLGKFTYAHTHAGDLPGLLPHKIQDVPTTARLLVNQRARSLGSHA